MARNTVNRPESDNLERDSVTRQQVEPVPDANVRNVGPRMPAGDGPMAGSVDGPMTQTTQTRQEYVQPQRQEYMQAQPQQRQDAPGWVAANDRVRWGPVWAGLLTTVTCLLVLELLAYGIGLLRGGSASGWVTGIIALIAFFVGGWVAEATSAARGASAGILNGFMVWALGISLIVVLSLLGLNSLFGAAGSTLGQIAASGRTVNAGGIGVSTGTVSHITNLAAWGGFIFLVATAIVAALGGLISSRGNPIGRMARTRDVV